MNDFQFIIMNNNNKNIMKVLKRMNVYEKFHGNHVTYNKELKRTTTKRNNINN